MPKIRWHSLPLKLKNHLAERLRDRGITQEDLLKMLRWIDDNPEVPEGPWWKDFGSFKLAGEGSYPKTFLTPQQPAFGQKL